MIYFTVKKELYFAEVCRLIISSDIKERILRLREHVLQPPQVCVEKGKYMTESYRRTEGEPEYWRRAKALKNILEKMTLTIYDDEKLVGTVTSRPRGGALSPEINCSWYIDQMDVLSTRDSDRFAPVEDWEKDEIRNMVSYWTGKSLFERWNAAVPEKCKEKASLVFSGGAFSGNTQYYGHFAVLYERLLSGGIKKIREEIEKSQAKFASAGDRDKCDYLEAMKMAVDTAPMLAERYAELAREMAAAEEPGIRRSELEQIADICERVPENPARSFREALQSVWFAYVVMVMESWGASPCLDRIDQYLYPYYKADVEAGRITDEEVIELIAMFFIKCNEQLTIYHTEATKIFGGMTSRISINLGGIGADGKTAVNPLSYLILEAEELVACGEDMVIQVGERTPDEFMLRAVKLAKAVRGKIKFVGEDVLHRNLVSYGVCREDQYDQVVTGCNTMGVPGVTLDMPGGIVNLPLMLDLAMYDGYSPYLGMQIGPHTGKAEGFSSWEELFEAFKRQFDYFIPDIEFQKNKDKELYGQYMQAPFQSALYDICIERGMDVMSGAVAPNMAFGISLAGAPNVGDSLAVVRKLVFEDKRLTMAELLEACRNDFIGYENVLHMINSVPKFGNGDSYVDNIVDEVLSYCSDKAAQYPGYMGARSTVAAAAITANIPHGKNVGAQPDGRRAGTPLSEGGISPHQGRNVSGTTATMLSVGRLNHQKLGNGSVLNMRIDPDILKGDAELMKLAQEIKGFNAIGGYLVQFNIVSTETLRDAQKHPEQYKDLIVRVATYSAYFIELSQELQEDIINRLEFKSL